MKDNIIDQVLYFSLSKIKIAVYRRQMFKENKRQKIFDSQFKDAKYFDYTLSNRTKIRLYKDSVLSKFIYFGFENDELEFMQKFLKPGDTFFDIGANIGLFTILAAEKVGKNGSVFSFEPSPKTFGRLKDNIELNGLTNVVANNVGLSDTNDFLKLNISESGHDAWNSFATTKNDLLHSHVEVKVVVLNDFLTENNIANIDLIKLDVEGWEKFVLKGSEKFLKSHSPTLLVEFTEANTFAAGYLVQEIYDLLQSWGYTWYRYENGSLVIEEKRLRYPYDNLIATKNIDKVQSRLHA